MIFAGHKVAVRLAHSAHSAAKYLAPRHALAQNTPTAMDRTQSSEGNVDDSILDILAFVSNELVAIGYLWTMGEEGGVQSGAH